MDETPRGYPYPEQSDRVDVATHIQGAVTAVDTDVQAHIDDADDATTSLHHTIGTGATQAAAGNHQHTQSTSHNSPDTDASWNAIHHTLGANANQAAAGNHNHNIGDLTGAGKQIVASGQAQVTVTAATYDPTDVTPPITRPSGTVDVAYSGHQSYRLLAFAQGGAGVYCIGDQSLSTTYFRLSVWYDYTLATDETRYVNWILVQM